MQICNKMYHKLNKAVKDAKREKSNLRRALAGAIRINIKLAKVCREQKVEIDELNKRTDIIRFHEVANTLEALMNGTDALLAKTESKDAFIEQLEAENDLLFHNNEKLFGTISEQRMEVDQLRTENQQLVGENQCLLSTLSEQKMLIVQLKQKEDVLMKKLEQAKRGVRTAGTNVVTVENQQLFEKNEELFNTVTNQEVMIFQVEQEKQKYWNQLQETKDEVETLTMEVMEERAESEAIEAQLVAELNFSIEQIGVANRLKEKLASVEDENTKATIELLEKMHQEVMDHELEIEAWNRDEERMLEQLEAANKRVIELEEEMLEQLEATNKKVIELEEEVHHWETGHYRFVPTETDSDDEEDTDDEDDTTTEDEDLEEDLEEDPEEDLEEGLEEGLEEDFEEEEEDCDFPRASAAKKRKLED
ncbi:unnamed protein product [Caenorhabditis brenneri]